MASALDRASLDEQERRTVERLVELLRKGLGSDLRAIWMYGSRARGEPRRDDSDVDLLVIADGGWDRYEQKAIHLMLEAAQREGASPAFFSVKTFDPDWVEQRRAIRSFFIQEVDRDKVVLFGAP